MASVKHTCDNCDSKFTIKYDEENTETDPVHCPFCGEYLIENENYEDDEDDE